MTQTRLRQTNLRQPVVIKHILVGDICILFLSLVRFATTNTLRGAAQINGDIFGFVRKYKILHRPQVTSEFILFLSYLICTRYHDNAPTDLYKYVEH